MVSFAESTEVQYFSRFSCGRGLMTQLCPAVLRSIIWARLSA